MALYRFELDIPALPAVVLEQLRAVTRQPRSLGESLRQAFSFSGNDKALFIGDVGGERFKLQRNIRYRNSFLPRIRGTVTSTGTGSQVSVNMSLHSGVLLFMLLWLSVPVLGIFATPANPAAYLIPVGFLLFAIGLVAAGFLPEAIKAKRMLTELCQAEPLPSEALAHLPPDAQPMGHWSAKLPATARSYHHLQAGQRYQVVQAFTDFDDTTHPVGESWIFLGYAFLPYEDGLSLFVSPDMQYELHIRLQDRDEEQGALIQALAAHIQPENPPSPAN